MTNKERMTQNIMHEFNLRTLNSKKDMLAYLEDYLTNFFDVPEGVVELEKDSKQMSLNIFGKYICFDYPEEKIEVRYTPKYEEIYLGSIVFLDSYPSPRWENREKELSKFDTNILDRFMENCFYSFEK
ncbi:hypothetical protein AABM34_16915 [Lysinibacillus fusiformis]